MTEHGEPFGKYELLERIALGGMAEIFRARTRGIGGFERTVAIKRLHRHLCHDQELVQMLLDEARLAVQLQHANIAQVFDLGSVNEQYFIVMEYIPGSDMHRVLRRVRELGRAVPTPIILYVLTEMLSGLDYAHNRQGTDGHDLQVVHRDVSPQNIMFSVSGEVKLIDFGIAKARMQMMETQAGIIKGKFYYMSPEQAHGQKLDRRSDVFAAGMVLYELLTGRPAYDETHDIELLKSVRACRFKPPSHWRRSLDPKLVEIVMRALHKDKRQRYQSARELQQALHHYMNLSRMSVSKFQAAEFLDSVLVMEESDSGPDRPMVMGREEFRADESSMIFKPGDKLIIPPSPHHDTEVVARPVSFAPSLGEMGSNPFADAEEETFVYTGPSTQKDNPFAIPDDVLMTHSGQVSWSGRLEEEIPEFHASEFDTVPPDEGIEPQKTKGFTLPTPPSAIEGYGQLLAPAIVPVPDTSPHLDQAAARSPKRKAALYLSLLLSPAHRVKVAIIALLLLLLGAGVVFARSEAEDPAEEPIATAPVSPGPDTQRASELFSLSIASAPDDAMVYRDGVFLGKTPMTMAKVSYDKPYKLTLEKEGFKTWEQTLTFEPGQKDLDLTLERAIEYGSIEIASVPPGLEVRVNSIKLKEKSPVHLDHQDRSKTYDVQVLAMQDGEPVVRSRSVSWKEGDPDKKSVRFDLDLALTPEKEERQVRKTTTKVRRDPPPRPPKRPKEDSPPPKKDVTIPIWNDSPVAAPKKEKNSDEGFSVWDKKSDDIPMPKNGYLSVKIIGDARAISIDGKRVPGSSNLARRPIPSGAHRVEVTFEGSGQSKTKNVDIKPGETTTVAFP